MRTVDCSACGARFAVPDELFSRALAGRQRRIVCKRCGARVLIDATRLAPSGTAWLVSFGPDDDRELSVEDLRAGVNSGAITGNTLVWREGMDEWLALRAVAELATVFAPRPAAGAAPPPAAATDSTEEPDEDDDPTPPEVEPASGETGHVDAADAPAADEPAPNLDAATEREVPREAGVPAGSSDSPNAESPLASSADPADHEDEPLAGEADATVRLEREPYEPLAGEGTLGPGASDTGEAASAAAAGPEGAESTGDPTGEGPPGRAPSPVAPQDRPTTESERDASAVPAASLATPDPTRPVEPTPPRPAAVRQAPLLRGVPSRDRRGPAELHGLFAVESIPPVAELDDTEVLSVPPSSPVKGPALPVIIPRAGRLPREATKDQRRAQERAAAAAAFGMPETPVGTGAATEGLRLAPIHEAALYAPVPPPEEPPAAVDAPSPDADAEVDVELDAPVGAVAAGVRPEPREEEALPHGGWRPSWLWVGAAVGVAFLAAALLLRDRSAATTDSPKSAILASASTRPSETAAPGRPSTPTTESSGSARVEPPTTPTAEPAPPTAEAAPATHGAPPVPAQPRSAVTAATPPTGASPRAAATTPAPATARTASPAPAGRTAAAPPAPAPGGAAFDRAAAAAALTSAAANASSCRRGSDPSGMATVSVTFAPSGRITSVNVNGPPFAGTATGGCIASTLRSATIPPFEGGHVTVTKRIVVQ